MERGAGVYVQGATVVREGLWTGIYSAVCKVFVLDSLRRLTRIGLSYEADILPSIGFRIFYVPILVFWPSLSYYTRANKEIVPLQT